MMGVHPCEYCLLDQRQFGQGDLFLPKQKGRFNPTSSGDTTVLFTSGRMWQFPDMVLHYTADHNWLPDQEFIDDVMNADVVVVRRMQTRSMEVPTRIGYLEGPYPQGSVPEGFLARLLAIMEKGGYRLIRGEGLAPR